VLRRHRLSIDPTHWPRTLIQTGLSASNSVVARIERRRFGPRIEATEVIRRTFPAIALSRPGGHHAPNSKAR
jgi:acetoin utilization deacetylase AcuC-like enzyme